MLNSDNLTELLQYPCFMKKAVDNKIHSDEIHSLAETAYSGENFNFALLKQTPEIRLIVVSCLLLKKYAEYKDKGVPDKIILDTFGDVVLRASLYFKNNGEVGITEEDVIWFRHIMNINIFKIGALQYQPFEMLYLDEETLGEPYMTFSEHQKTVLPAKSPVINVHIQRGADLSSSAVGASLNAARKFFTTTFPQSKYQTFLCYSRLLYPPMTSRLGKQSNIKQFADRFKIIGVCDDSEQAVENIRNNDKTRLAKMAENDMRLFGYACGIIDF